MAGNKKVLVIREKQIEAARFRGKRVKVYGECVFDGELTIDPRQSEEERFDSLAHELSHFLLPDATEETVTDHAALISTVLWECGYRRVLLK